ncbi:S24 family peptidase [Melissococcus plutonius]|uniref:S24 family peptidase n=2 Tax=Melissococcus plutonius TaxID=33970 RepID=UPI003C2DF945
MNALGNKEIMAKNLQYYMDKYGVDRNKLSNDLNIKYTTLTDWLKANTYPRIDKIELLANYFGIPKSNLVEESVADITTIYNKLKSHRQKIVLKTAEQQLNEQKHEQQSNVVPFNSSNNDPLTSFDWYGYVSAGTGEFLDGNESKTTIQLPKKDISSNADFALTVNGDSMKPVFKNHEMIFVERTTDLPSGSIGIVIVDGEAFVKKIYIHDDCMTLVSLNPAYADKVIKDAQSIKVIGRVII